MHRIIQLLEITVRNFWQYIEILNELHDETAESRLLIQHRAGSPEQNYKCEFDSIRIQGQYSVPLFEKER